MAIPVTFSYPKMIGQVTDLKETQSTFGEGENQRTVDQIAVMLLPANPTATSYRTIFMPNSDAKSGKWSKFLDSFYMARNLALGTNEKAKTASDLTEMLVGAWVEVEDTVGGVIRQTQKEWTLSLVTQYFKTEEEARAAHAAKNPGESGYIPTTGMEPPASWQHPAPPIEPITPVVVPTNVPIDPGVATMLVENFQKSGKPFPVFFDTEVKSWGYTKEQVAVALGVTLVP